MSMTNFILLAPYFTLPGGIDLFNPVNAQFALAGGNFGAVISAALPYLFIIGGLILFAMLLMGGFDIMTSLGSEEKTKSGYEKIKNALIGFLLLFASYWLAQIAQILFKIQIL